MLQKLALETWKESMKYGRYSSETIVAAVVMEQIWLAKVIKKQFVYTRSTLWSNHNRITPAMQKSSDRAGHEFSSGNLDCAPRNNATDGFYIRVVHVAGLSLVN